MKFQSTVLGLFLLFDLSGCGIRGIKGIKEFNNPSKNACWNNGGYYNNDIGTWHNVYHSCTRLSINEANKACSERGMYLPTLNEFLRIAKECGSENTIKSGDSLEWKNTKSKKLYEKCLIEKGFIKNKNYLTSTKTSNGDTINFNPFYTSGSWRRKTSLLPNKSWGYITITKEKEISYSVVVCKVKKQN